MSKIYEVDIKNKATGVAVECIYSGEDYDEACKATAKNPNAAEYVLAPYAVGEGMTVFGVGEHKYNVWAETVRGDKFPLFTDKNGRELAAWIEENCIAHGVSLQYWAQFRGNTIEGVVLPAKEAWFTIKYENSNLGKEKVLAVSEKDIADWLNEQIKDITHGKMTTSIEPVSYDDYISEDTLLKWFNDYCEKVTTKDTDWVGYNFETYLSDVMLDDFLYDRIDDAEEYMIDEIEANLAKTSNEFQEAYEQHTCDMSASEKLDLGGFQGVSYEVKDFLDNNYQLNLMFATEAERNFDMGAISDAFNSDLSDINISAYNNEYEEIADNALTYLIHQQGHTLQEVYDELYKEGSAAENKFIRSTVDEINEMYYTMNELTFLVSARGQRLVELLDNIAHKTDYLSFSKETMVGLFNEWQGSGAALEIELEKAAILPTSMVRNVQIEKAGKENDGVTVNEVYGLSGKAWEYGEVTLTNTAPVQKEENAQDALNNLRKHYDRNERSKGNMER